MNVVNTWTLPSFWKCDKPKSPLINEDSIDQSRQSHLPLEKLSHTRCEVAYLGFKDRNNCNDDFDCNFCWVDGHNLDTGSCFDWFPTEEPAPGMSCDKN